MTSIKNVNADGTWSRLGEANFTNENKIGAKAITTLVESDGSQPFAVTVGAVTSELKVWSYNPDKDQWVQVGQTIPNVFPGSHENSDVVAIVYGYGGGSVATVPHIAFAELDPSDKQYKITVMKVDVTGNTLEPVGKPRFDTFGLGGKIRIIHSVGLSRPDDVVHAIAYNQSEGAGLGPVVTRFFFSKSNPVWTIIPGFPENLKLKTWDMYNSAEMGPQGYNDVRLDFIEPTASNESSKDEASGSTITGLIVISDGGRKWVPNSSKPVSIGTVNSFQTAIPGGSGTAERDPDYMLGTAAGGFVIQPNVKSGEEPLIPIPRTLPNCTGTVIPNGQFHVGSDGSTNAIYYVSFRKDSPPEDAGLLGVMRNTLGGQADAWFATGARADGTVDGSNKSTHVVFASREIDEVSGATLPVMLTSKFNSSLNNRGTAYNFNEIKTDE